MWILALIVVAGVVAVALKRAPIREDSNRTAGSPAAPPPPQGIAGPPLPVMAPDGGPGGILSAPSASLAAPTATIRPAAEPANVVNLLAGPVHTDTSVKTESAPLVTGVPNVGLTAGPVYSPAPLSAKDAGTIAGTKIALGSKDPLLSTSLK